MSLLRRRTVLRRFFAALERIASNVGLIREAGKEFRLFSAEEVTLVRQLAESRQRLQDLRAQRDEESRLVHSILARQVKEAVANRPNN
ncbi:surface antigen [Chlorella sorokiniana]|uniref:Surface antigen n=1 Tax=Chlorella sorokiniana TaxID=3076 RepID=A0A2P6U2M5_CHLSO|nr:surface antigen [Chlorella sorokiniana]|eukprot:PRW60550.1 surface antigen [Chlorella sorokiniana]